jgi:hypothetical protein
MYSLKSVEHSVTEAETAIGSTRPVPASQHLDTSHHIFRATSATDSLPICSTVRCRLTPGPNPNLNPTPVPVPSPSSCPTARRNPERIAQLTTGRDGSRPIVACRLTACVRIDWE